VTYSAAVQWGETGQDGDFEDEDPRRGGGRRWGGVLLGLLLAVLGAGGALWLGSGSAPTVEAVALARQVQRGQVITAGDVAVVRVAASGGAVRLATPATARAVVLGRQALVDLPAGTLLTPELVGSVAGPAGTLTLGVAVDAAGLPSSALRAGERVDVVGLDPVSKDPVTLAEQVTVTEVRRPGGGSQAGETVVYLAVPAEQAARVAAAAAGSGVRLLGVTAPAEGGGAEVPGARAGGSGAEPGGGGGAGGAGTGGVATAAGLTPAVPSAAADAGVPSAGAGSAGVGAASTAGTAGPGGVSPTVRPTGGGVAGVLGGGG